ncbi:MAG: S1C family serine protease [Actinoallomurus sp.]
MGAETPAGAEAPAGLEALSTHLAERAASLRPSVVSVHTGRGGRGAPRSGAGVIWQADGLIVTNAHVVDQPRAHVVLEDGREFEATLVAREPTLDLAALRVAAAGLPAARVGDSDALRVGEIVFAMGHPLGQPHAVAWGIVRASPDTLDVGQRGRRQPGAPGTIQADLRLYPGNSGGPLADARGRVVGINHMVVPPRLALAIPSAAVRGFIARLQGARLGVRVRAVDLPPPLVERLHLPTSRGVMLVDVAADQAAGRAGLLPGDVLLTADDRWLTDADALVRTLQEAPAGDHATTMRLRMLRGGTVREVEVALRSPA